LQYHYRDISHPHANTNAREDWFNEKNWLSKTTEQKTKASSKKPVVVVSSFLKAKKTTWATKCLS
jgi:hypothetical protein